MMSLGRHSLVLNSTLPGSSGAQVGRPAALQPDEAAVYDFCMELSTAHVVSDEVFARTRSLLGEQALADLTVISGVYVTISMILNVAQARAPENDPLPFSES